MTVVGSVPTRIDSVPRIVPTRMDQIRENEIGSVPNPRQTIRATTASRNAPPTQKSHRRIVSAGKEETGNDLGRGDCTHPLDAVEDGEMVNGGTFAMGFTSRVFFMGAKNTIAQSTQGQKRMAFCVAGS